MRRHQPGGQEPGAQAEVAAVQHRAGGDRDLPLARRALERQPFPGQLPALVVPAGRAAKPVRPPLLHQPAGAGRVIGEPGLELGQRSRQPAIPSTPTRSGTTYSATGARGMSHFEGSNRHGGPKSRLGVAPASRYGPAEDHDDLPSAASSRGRAPRYGSAKSVTAERLRARPLFSKAPVSDLEHGGLA